MRTKLVFDGRDIVENAVGDCSLNFPSSTKTRNIYSCDFYITHSFANCDKTQKQIVDFRRCSTYQIAKLLEGGLKCQDQ